MLFAMPMQDESSDFDTRFAAVARLYGQAGLDRLRTAHVAVVGLGGVGSWAVEALARSGVGALTLIDLDEVCLSNVNRQLPALDGNVGRFKADVLAERVRLINPACTVRAIPEFFTAGSADRLFAEPFTVVVDAIDALANKCRLIAACRARSLPVVVSGGAGGRRDPARLRTADLADATHDRLLAAVRQSLRHEHGFPAAGRPLGIPCVFSTEPPILPLEDGAVCAATGTGTSRPSHQPPVRRLSCDGGYGSAVFVTGAFGLAAAALAVARITGPGE